MDGGSGKGGSNGDASSSKLQSGGDSGFSIDAACGYANIATERAPGALVIVLDNSSSMNDPPITGEGHGGQDAGPSKWLDAQGAIHAVLEALPDSLQMGYLGFPDDSGDDCEAPTTPQVPVAPLSTSRTEIYSYVDPQDATGGNTPTYGALVAAYDYLENLTSVTGQKGVILITDGGWNCWASGQSDDQLTDAIYSSASDAYNTHGVQTFTVDVPGGDDPSMSTLASWGGTGAPGCDPTCNTTPCCDYQTGAATFQADLTTALNEIAAQFLQSCVFTIPKGSKGFDPTLVNVVVTETEEKAETVPQNATTGWTYVNASDDAIEFHGAICQEVLSTSASVQIILGCPTVVK